jgi:hypothetical protein
MINYPVRVVKDDIVDSNNNWVASGNLLDVNTIANALNAMNDLPNFKLISDNADEGDKNEAIVDCLNIWLNRR